MNAPAAGRVSPGIWSEAMRRWILRAGLLYLIASLGAGIVLGEFALQRGRLPGGGPDARLRAEAVARAHGAPASSRSASTPPTAWP